MNKQELIQHLQARGMNPHLYNLSYDEGLVVFPLYDFSGRQTGYQNYRPFAERNHKNDPRLARYFTRLPKGVDGYFGTESLEYPGTVYVVEGVFKAGKLHRLGYPSISAMGSEGHRIRNQLYIYSSYRNFVAVGDNDDAGRKFARDLGGFTSPYDLDEMEDGDVRRLLDGHERSK